MTSLAGMACGGILREDGDSGPATVTTTSRSFEVGVRSLAAGTAGITGFNLDYEQMVFVVASDDPQWCKTQFGTMPNKTVIFANEAFKDNLGFDRKYLDMAIMSKCNHSIFDYGTFGFWGPIWRRSYDTGPSHWHWQEIPKWRTSGKLNCQLALH
ncbi:hypothetical protein TCAL_16732 [Tigriopus californicus]|uniref:L-Fucosyltransferase n=1 Tax=Tigriopus californicus TaxID=6832 RepID=A0A553PTR9_TIGCA|nr:hypothetical protein TCAL_16732 [Tigriopus californicus]